MVQTNQARRLLQTVFRRRFETIVLNPRDVGYIQYPEFRDLQQILMRPKTRRLGGDWDRPLNTTVYWCSVYEPAVESGRGMVPLARYEFYKALELHFLDGQSWEATAWYRWMVNRKESVPVRRYATSAEMQQRLSLLDSLYAEFRTGNYLDDPIDRPIVNIGREGRIALEDGRHRLCVARLAGVKEIRVDVDVVHTGAQWSGTT